MSTARAFAHLLRGHLGAWLLALALASLLATYTRPTITLPQLHFSYLAVLDITQSMNVRDAGGDGTASRLEFAKHMLHEAVDLLPCGNDLGIGIFTQHRTALLIAPVEVCGNYAELLTLIDKIDWRMAWDARSEVAKGLYSGVEVAETLGEHTRVVFFTDGHEAPPVNPRFRPRFDGTAGRITGLVIGVGGDVPAPIPKFDQNGEQRGHWRANEVLQVDTYSMGRSTANGEQLAGVEPGDIARRIAAGTEHLSSLHEQYLLRTATAIGLDYHRLRDARALAEALTLPRFGIPRPARVDLRKVFVALALVLVLAHYAAGRFARRPARRGAHPPRTSIS